MPFGTLEGLRAGPHGTADVLATGTRGRTFGVRRGRIRLREARPSLPSLAAAPHTAGFDATKVRDAPSPVLTDRGALVAFTVLRDGRRTTAATTYGRAGTRARTQIVSPRGMSSDEPVAVAGGGAAGVLFLSRDRVTQRRPVMRWAFRAPGARRFAPSKVVIDTDSPRNYHSHVVLGPKGDGALLITPLQTDDQPLHIRRLRADGGLGPWLDVPGSTTGLAFADLTVMPDGTFAFVWAGPGPGPGPDAPDHLWVSTLAPGAAAPTTPQELAVDDASGGLDIYGAVIAAGGRGQLLVAAAREDPADRLQLFAGKPGAMRLAADFAASYPSAVVTVTTDGGAWAAWGGVQGGYGVAPLLITHRPLGGTFSRPTAIARTRFTGVDADSLAPNAIAPAPGDRALLAFTDSGGEQRRSAIAVLAP